MKQKDVVIGGRYLIRVGGRLKLDTVFINDTQDRRGVHRRFTGINQRTGRPLGWFTAARLRGPAPGTLPPPPHIKCEGCGQSATLEVNGHPVCLHCVDLPSEEGEESTVDALGCPERNDD